MAFACKKKKKRENVYPKHPNTTPPPPHRQTKAAADRAKRKSIGALPAPSNQTGLTIGVGLSIPGRLPVERPNSDENCYRYTMEDRSFGLPVYDGRPVFWHAPKPILALLTVLSARDGQSRRVQTAVSFSFITTMYDRQQQQLVCS